MTSNPQGVCPPSRCVGHHERMSNPLGQGPGEDALASPLGRTRPRPWETAVLSLLLGVPPALLATFWIDYRIRDQRARALSPDDYMLYDPHGYVLIFGSVLLLGLVLLAGLALVPWTLRLFRRRARAVWLPIVLNAVDLLPLAGVVLLLLFFLVSIPLGL